MSTDLAQAGAEHHHTWSEFADALVELVPALTGTIDHDVHFNRADRFGSFDRVALQRALQLLIPGASMDLIRAIETPGEAFEWHRTVLRPDPSPWPAPSRMDLITPFIGLRPIEPTDLDALYRSAVDPRSSYRWRFRGAVPSPADFKQHLYTGTLTQYAVEDRASGELQGLVTAYNANADAGHAYVAFYRSSSPPTKSSGQMSEGLFVLIDYLFRTWTFRKIYCEIPAYNLHFLHGYDGPLATQEGQLADHLFHNGVYHDLHLIAIYREAFGRFADTWWAQMEHAGDPGSAAS